MENPEQPAPVSTALLERIAAKKEAEARERAVIQQMVDLIELSAIWARQALQHQKLAIEAYGHVAELTRRIEVLTGSLPPAA
jgi:hypothetical protein